MRALGFPIRLFGFPFWRRLGSSLRCFALGTALRVFIPSRVPTLKAITAVKCCIDQYARSLLNIFIGLVKS